MALAELLVPGLARPLLEVLALVCSAAVEMHESQELCLRAGKKLAFVYEKLEAMQAKSTLPSDALLHEYTTLVGDYCAFLLKHQKKPWIYRVVTYKRVVRKVAEVQNIIGDLMHALSLWHVEAMADERRLQSEFRQQQVRLIEARLVDDAVVATEVARVPQQLEALSVFRHELLAPHDTSDGDSDQKVVRTALNKVMHRSDVRVPSVPEWFVPPHKVEYEPRMFARGSFGSVHLGKMGAVAVVVKCLLVDTRESERLTASFRREADLWFQFRHPNVLTMYGACDVTSPPFLVCEYAANSNLSNYLGSARNQPFTFKLLHEAAAGLLYLHEKRVVHADLTGYNILVMADGTAKIADFSFSYVRTLSASKQSADDPTAATNTWGALMWRAPECFEGRRPTSASDVYAFGMCIIEAVSGEVPWGYFVDSVTVRELVKAGKLPDQPELMSDLVWALVQHMCSFDPSERPTMETVVQALGEFAVEEAAARVLPPEQANTESPYARSSTMSNNSRVNASTVSIDSSPPSGSPAAPNSVLPPTIAAPASTTPASTTPPVGSSSTTTTSPRTAPRSRRTKHFNDDFEQICTLAMQALQCPMAGIRTDDFELVRFFEDKAPTRFSHWLPPGLPRSLPTFRRIATMGRPCVVMDVSSDKRISGEKRATAKLQFFVGIPLVVDGEVVGDLCVADRIARRSVDSKQLEVLNALARSVTQYMQSPRYVVDLAVFRSMRCDLKEVAF